jgi:hypothetical protein
LGLPDGREHDNVLVITKPDRLPETSSTAARRGGVGRLITGPAFLQWQKRRHGLPACRGFSCCTTAESVPASCAGMQIATGRANPPMWVQDDTAQLESVIRRIAVAALDHRLTGCRPLEATVVLWSSKGNRRQRRQVCVKID